VLSHTEIEQIIEATDNAKYKLMISLGYACGMRVSEVVNLRVADLDIDELVVHIKGAKEGPIQKSYNITYTEL